MIKGMLAVLLALLGLDELIGDDVTETECPAPSDEAQVSVPTTDAVEQSPSPSTGMEHDPGYQSALKHSEIATNDAWTARMNTPW